jgi:hypothetical protein
MYLALNEFYGGSELLPTAHMFVLHYAEADCCGVEELAGRLHLFTGRRLQPIWIEGVREALRLDSGEVAA